MCGAVIRIASNVAMAAWTRCTREEQGTKTMNRAYRIVWNAALGVWQAVSELAVSHAKGTGTGSGRKRRLRTAAMVLSLSLVAPLAQAADILLVGTGGTGGGDGGTGTIRGGNGGADFFLPGSGGASGIPAPTQTIASPANGSMLLATYDDVGIGGGAGGGDGGNLGGINGSNGGAGILTLNGTALTVTNTLLIGGAGGGGGSGGAGGTPGGNGGTGGSGTLTVTGGASITVGTQLYIGGLGGTGGNCGCSGNGGAGGAGVFNLGGASTLNLAGASFTINGNSTLNIGNDTANGATAGTITGLSGSINNAGTINFNQSDAAYTFSTSIAGTGQVVQNGSGTTFLTGANSYSGGTTINAGLINFANGGNLGTGNVTLDGGGLQWATGNTTDISGRLNALGASGGTLDTNGNNVTLASGLSGTGGLTKAGAGTLTLTSINTYTGGTIITGGTLALGAGVSLAATGAINLANAGTTFDISASGAQTIGALSGAAGSTVNLGGNALTVDSSGNSTFGGTITGTAGVTFAGTGTQTLTGANTYTGSTTVNTGTLALAGAGSIAMSNGLVDNGTFDISGTTAGASIAALSGSGIVVLGSQTLTLSGAGGTFGGAMDGAGGLALAGGTQTLNGASAYSGGTKLDGGTLMVGNSAALGTGALNVDGAATLDTNTSVTLANSVNLGTGAILTLGGSNNLTMGGTMAGEGALVKNGAATATLTGANTYTGGTTIHAGTLALGVGGRLASTGAVNLAASGATFDLSAASAQTIGTLSGVAGSSVNLGANALTLRDTGNTTYAGSMGGTGGSLTLAGAGTMTLTGANTYSGGTNLNNGGLAVGNNAALGTGVLNIGGSVALDSTTNVVLGNAIKLGTGTTLTIGGSHGLDLSGAISGAGNLVKSGAATTTLSGVNTYTGTTTIDGGTLALAGAGSLAAATSVALSGIGATFDLSAGSSQSIAHLSGVSGSQVTLGTSTLTLTDDTSQTFSGSVAGNGGLVKQGAGTLTLNGNSSTFIGTTIVSGGTLAVGDAANASAVLGGNVQVDTQGTLRGHGTVTGNVVSDGTVWPGGSVGVLIINGNYTQNADATLQIDVTPTQASQLLVHGNAALGGTLSLIYAPGTYTTATYTLVQANALTGTFASTTSSGAVPTALSPTVAYTSTQANLVLTSPTPSNPTPPIVVAPHDGELYANVMHAANLIEQQSMTTVLNATLRLADASCGNGGAVHANTLAPSCNNGVWAQYSSSSNEFTGSNGLNSTAFGLQGGADVSVAEQMHVGLEAGLEHINSSDRNGGYGHVDNVHGGIYAFANTGPLVVSGMLDEAHGSYRLYRQTGIGHAVASPDGNTTAAALQVAWPIAAAQWQVTPIVGALYQHQRLGGFNETVNSTSPLASSFALQGVQGTYTTLQPYAAVSFTHPFVAGGVSYVPQLEVGYRYDARHGNGVVVDALSQDGTLFALRGEATGRGMTTAGARITAQAGASWSMYLDYRGQFASHLGDNALSVGFIKTF